MTKVSKIFKDDKIKLISLAIIFAIITIFFFLRNVVNTDYISAFLVLVSIIIIFTYKPSFFLKYLFLFSYFILMIVGLLLCENANVYLNELDTYSGYHGSFSLAILYFFVLIICLFIFDRIFSKKFNYYNCTKDNHKLSIFKHFTKEKITNYLQIVIFLVGLLAFLSVASKPSFLLNVDRFTYEQLYLPGIARRIQIYYIYFVPLLILPILISKNKIDLKTILSIVVTILPFLLFSFWTGNKFGIFFDICVLILSPLIVYIGKKGLKRDSIDNLEIPVQDEKQLSGKIIKILSVITITLLMFLIPFYLLRNQNVVKSITNRLTQQGQLWWSVFEINEDGSFHLNELNDEIEPLFVANKPEDTNYNYGIYKIMRLTTPYDIFVNKVLSGSRYSSQGLEIAFYYFGYLGLFFHAILRALIEAFLVNLLIKFLFSYRLFSSCIITRLLKLNHSIFTQGDLFLIFSFKTMATIFVLLILEYIFDFFIRRKIYAKE